MLPAVIKAKQMGAQACTTRGMASIEGSCSCVKSWHDVSSAIFRLSSWPPCTNFIPATRSPPSTPPAQRYSAYIPTYVSASCIFPDSSVFPPLDPLLPHVTAGWDRGFRSAFLCFKLLSLLALTYEPAGVLLYFLSSHLLVIGPASSWILPIMPSMD